jgi:hypothetical protein
MLQWKKCRATCTNRSNNCRKLKLRQLWEINAATYVGIAPCRWISAACAASSFMKRVREHSTMYMYILWYDLHHSHPHQQVFFESGLMLP